MEPFTLHPDLGGHCQFGCMAVFHLILACFQMLIPSSEKLIITKGFQDEELLLYHPLLHSRRKQPP